MLYSDTIGVAVNTDDISFWVWLLTVVLRGSESCAEVAHVTVVQIGERSSLNSPAEWPKLFSLRTKPRCSGWTSLEQNVSLNNLSILRTFGAFYDLC